MPFPRQLEPEWMDDPTLDRERHLHALAGLRRVNIWSRSGQAMWGAIAQLARREQLSDIRILDLACGGGDIALFLARQARRNGLNVRVTGCDFSSVAIEEARRRAAECGESAVDFQERDVLADDLPPDYDVVCCSLFLHHLDESQAVQLLQRMSSAARRLVLVDDLRRTRLGYWLAWLGCHVLTRSPVVHQDGPQSVAGAFTPQEARQLAAAAGLHQVSIKYHWPQRYLMSWSPPG